MNEREENCSRAEGLCVFNTLTDRTAVRAMHDVKGAGGYIISCSLIFSYSLLQNFYNQADSNSNVH